MQPRDSRGIAPQPVELFVLAGGDWQGLRAGNARRQSWPPEPEGPQEWKVLVTPGHCPGHVCLLGSAGLIAGDMVAGIGTILIPPEEGVMEDYIEQLKRLKDLNPHILFPSHGPMLPLPEKTLEYYIKHRTARHQRVLDAVNSGITDLGAISESAYENTPDAHPGLAKQQTLSHLLAWQRSGEIFEQSRGWHPNG